MVKKAFPDLEHIDSLKYLAGITFIFVGIEMSSVYASFERL